MHASFSFCGTDIEDLGLSYAPEIENTYISKPANSVSHIQTFDSHDGGYFYGSNFEPKEFTLRCYFEEQSIETRVLAEVYRLFKVGTSGKLIFSRNPWCYYYATVTDPIDLNLTNYLNGSLTIHMKAMYPFARSDVLKNTRAEKYHDQLMSNSAVFEKDEMILPYSYNNLTQKTKLILANQGTERAALGVAIAGNVNDGVVITNETTGQSCKFVAVKKEKTSDVNKEVIIDPISGKTTLVGAGTKELAFLYHEYGFLELESSFPAVRNIYVNSLGSESLNIANILNQNMVGKYIFAVNQWRKIIDQPDKHTLVVDSEVPAGSMERTMIIPMNEIIVTPITTMDITSLRFIYKPTYA